MFLESNHVVSAHSLADSMLLYIAREAIFEELERDGRFARRMIAGLSRRLHYRDRQVPLGTDSDRRMGGNLPGQFGR